VGEQLVLLWEPACRRIIVRQHRGQGPLPQKSIRGQGPLSQKSRCEPLWSPVWATSDAAFVEPTLGASKTTRCAATPCPES
jgi:hypothetical protein